MSLNTCIQKSNGNILTAEGRLSYPSLFKPSMPKGEKDQSKARYQATLLFPKATFEGGGLKLLADAVEKCAVEKWGADYAKKFKVKKPFLKTEDQPKQAELAPDFPVFIRCNSEQKPQIVDSAVKNVDDESQVYPGRWARISVRPYAYDHPTGGKGVSLGLQNVQLLRDDDRLAGARSSADDDFEAADAATGNKKGADTDAMFS